MDADHDDGLTARHRNIEDLLGEGEPPGLTARELKEEVSNCMPSVQMKRNLSPNKRRTRAS